MSSDAGGRASFFPKADAAVLHTDYDPPSPSTRPAEVGPILDPQNANKALDAWSAAIARDLYPSPTDIWSPAPIPDESLATTCIADRYLFPLLTRNERLRLTMLFYYTRGILEDKELISRLQEKVHLAQETVGWEFAITGLLDHNTYTRIVTVGLPLAVLPRRESTCAHTVNQPPGKIFNLANMAGDWRFKASPHVEQGGLRAYAGVPLRFETEFGQEQHVAFGSLCVASNTEQPPLTKAEQMSLARLADWIVADIVQSARARRQRERRKMMELLVVAQKQIDVDENFEVAILDMLRKIYPDSFVSIITSIDDQLILEGSTEVPVNQIEQGLWEDGEYFDHLIEHFNHLDPVAPRIVRAVTAQCASQRIPTYLVVGSKDFRVVFDDVDSSFLHMAAEILSRGWQNLALREALSAKDNFLRGITHQLRTPIHGILGSLELLAEELGARETMSQSSGSRRGSAASTMNGDHTDPNTYIKTIRSSARDLISTVNSLINLNRWTDIAQAERIVAPHHIHEIEAALLNEVLQAHLDLFSKRPSIMFKHHFPEHFDSLALDLRLFVDCIQPLITNAIQATEGGIVCVTMTVTHENAVLVVDIEDTGKGIPSSDHESIFRAYEKVDNHTTGAGLGLTVASRLASIMNGVVTLVKSEIGEGSHFRATFDRPAWLAAYRRTSVTEDALLTFDAPTSPHPASLSSYYVRYLLHRGHSQSENNDGSIYISDHSTDFQYEQHSTQLQSGKAGICLIPDSADHPLMHEGEQIRRVEDTIYIKGPFLSSILEQAWSQARDIHIELEALKHATETNASLEEPIEDTEPAGTSDDASGLPTPLSSTSLASEPTLLEIADTLAVTLQTVHLERPSPVHPRQPTRPVTLIVDDNAINLRFLEMYCRRRDIRHLTATDGLRAVEAFLLHQTMAFASEPASTDIEPIALILMDLQMPNCDGVEGTRQIRNLEKVNGWPKSTIIIVTGQDSPQDRTLSKDAGADDFFVKPVGPKVLDSGIKDWFPEAKV